MVRAKFKVQSVTASLSSRQKPGATDWRPESVEPVEMRTIKLVPVMGNGEPEHENTKFWNASPSGVIELGTINPEAWRAFELGGEYYIDFTRAD
jgi:hypothetical protein